MSDNALPLLVVIFGGFIAFFSQNAMKSCGYFAGIFLIALILTKVKFIITVVKNMVGLLVLCFRCMFVFISKKNSIFLQFFALTLL